MLTLCEDKVVLLDETLEGVLLKVDNVGSGGQGGCAEQTQSCEVAHCDVMCEEVSKGKEGQAHEIQMCNVWVVLLEGIREVVQRRQITLNAC
jgi:hypothetical protein